MIKIEFRDALGKCLVAEQSIQKGTSFYRIENPIVLSEPTYQSVQVSPNQHILEDVIIYLNHSCHPNVFFDTEKLELRAIRDIAAGEELTFFYPSTEWHICRPFVCECSSDGCLEVIKGAKFLSDSLLTQYDLNAHIRALKAQTAELIH